MKIGIGFRIPSLSSLPGISRPGGGGGGGIIPTDPYPYKVSWNVSIGVPKEARIFRFYKSTGDLTIDWGDGTVDILSGTGGTITPVTHQYDGTVENPVMSIGDKENDTANFGGMWSVYQSIGAGRQDIRELIQWGQHSLYLPYYMFKYCEAMDMTATDTPDFSAATNMSNMFNGCFNFKGNESINTWDVSNITTMFAMFRDTRVFNQDLDNWDISNVTTIGQFMYSARGVSVFNSSVGNWDFSSCSVMDYMFTNNVAFDGSGLQTWKLGQGPLKAIRFCFQNCISLNKDLNMWDFSKIRDANSLLYNATSFNGDISTWDTSNVTNMYSMLRRTAMDYTNPGINTKQVTVDGNTYYAWDVSNVTSMQYMFYQAYDFDSDISNWDTSSLVDATGTFAYAYKFNSDIGSWDMSNVTSLSQFLYLATEFDGDLSSWNVDNCVNFYYLFASTKIDFDLSSWNVNGNLDRFLFDVDYNYDLGSMTLGPNINTMQYLFYRNATLSDVNWTNTIVGWANQVYNNSAPYNVNAANIATLASLQFDNSADGGANFETAGAARDYLAGAIAGWTITGDTRIN